MVLGKKAIIFTLIAIGLSGLFILLYTASFSVSVDQENENIRTRITSLDQTIDQFYEYAKEAQSIAGFESMQALYKEINDSPSHTYLGAGRFPERLLRCMNESDRCTNIYNLTILLDNYTAIIESSTGSTITYSVLDLDLVSESYNYIIIRGNISIHLTDEYASWEQNRGVTSTISTNGVYDPIYININDDYDGAEERRISIHDSKASSDIEEFIDFYAGKEYKAVDKDEYPNNEAPCLSERFEGDFDTATQGCGIESLVHADEHPDLMASGNYDITHLDWQVATGTTYGCFVDDPKDFRVDVAVVTGPLTIDYNTTKQYGIYSPDYLEYTGEDWISRGC